MEKENYNKLTRKDLIDIFGWKNDKYIANSLLTEKDIDTIKKDENDRLEIIGNRLIEYFGIKETSRFKEKLESVFAGSGSEQINITKLYSSSLCALLFFYNVSENNELRLQINEKEMVFKEVLFEFKNTVIEGRSPSNVDIVLLGKNKNNNKNCILFLESKFFEYCGDVKDEIKIAQSYSTNNIGKQIYNEKNIREIFNDNIDCLKINDIYIKLKKECYIEGIKQMISHYIGISNLFTNKNMQNLYMFLANKNMFDNIEIYLGEILFDFHNIIDDKYKKIFKEYFDNYSEKYKNLSNILKPLNNKITILAKPLEYSLFKNNKHKIEEQIFKHYKFNIK